MNIVNERSRAGEFEGLGSEPIFSRAYQKIRLFDQSIPLSKFIRSKVVIDVGSSTGGFTKFALEKGAQKVIAVELGTRQMEPNLAMDKRVKLNEKTDIMEVGNSKRYKVFVQDVATAVMDVSFVSSKEILIHLREDVLNKDSCIILLFKPQFEAFDKQLVNGIVKNSKIRRDIIKNFEMWLKLNKFRIVARQDSQLEGSKGNVERFYVLK